MQVMMKFNINSKIIDKIAKIYSQDYTTIYLNGEQQLDINVTSGIKQGCNGSTILFLLITYMIIEELQTKIQGFKNEKFNIPAIFYADDGLIFANSLKEAESSIVEVTRI